MGAGESVTVIVHGTYAEDESWWKPGTNLPPSAADDLEKALRSRGISGSVWRGLRDDPPTHLDLDEPTEISAVEAAFGWSGKNRHRDRVDAAAQMRTSLEALSDRFHTADGGAAREPLGVHLVAHSHGGNIVLEMMKKPPRDVDLRSITMLGTPLIWTFPAFRLIRIVFALLVAASFTWMVIPDPGESVGEIIVYSGFFLLVYPWLYFWLHRLGVMGLRTVDGVWRHAVRGGRSPGAPAYGPRPDGLRDQLGRPILLLRSAEDEADLMMHFGASPIDAYRSLVRPKPPRFENGIVSFVGRCIVWLLELTIIRPWIYILFVPVFEATVEHFGLGFPWSISMRRNQEMVSQRDRKSQLYPAEIINRVDVTAQLLPTLEREIRERAAAAVYVGYVPAGHGNEDGVVPEDRVRSDDEHLEALKATFLTLAQSFKGQFNLRHSMYYESAEIIEMVAAEIAAAERGEASPHVRPEPAHVKS